MPSTTSTEVEEWYVTQIYQLTKYRSDVDGALPKRFLNEPPEEMLKTLDPLLKEKGSKSDLMLAIYKSRVSKPVRNHAMNWFFPVVINHFEKFHRTKGMVPEDDDSDDLEGYNICFDNSSADQIHVAFDVILVSDEPSDDDSPEDPSEQGKVKKKHLTPLEEELSASIHAASSILNEMRYMEKRERRMRNTSDSINQKIQWFSYASVSILLGVTYVQVTYLKRYFKKKKLL